jgi:hypothetical protein
VSQIIFSPDVNAFCRKHLVERPFSSWLIATAGLQAKSRDEILGLFPFKWGHTYHYGELPLCLPPRRFVPARPIYILINRAGS